MVGGVQPPPTIFPANMKTIAEIAEILPGYQFRGRIPAFVLGGVAVIQGKDVCSDLSINPAELVHVQDGGSFDRFFLRENDLILMNRGARNYAALINIPLPRTVTLGSFYTLRPKLEVILPEYLLWVINDASVQADLASRARGTNIPHLSMSLLKDVKIPVPPIHEQKVIAVLAESIATEENLSRSLFEARRHLLSTKIFHPQVRRRLTHVVADE